MSDLLKYTDPVLNAALPRLYHVRHVTIASLSYATWDHRELAPPHGLETPNGNGVRWGSVEPR